MTGPADACAVRMFLHLPHDVCLVRAAIADHEQMKIGKLGREERERIEQEPMTLQRDEPANNADHLR